MGNLREGERVLVDDGTCGPGKIKEVTGGNTHAWVQVYVPGPGWVDIDPSSGTVGNENLVRVAVVHETHQAIPLQGTWIGSASDHLAMKVAVKVIAATNTGAGRVAGTGR
jgi:transglutaminase-like putative cysteine protease